MKNTVGSLIGIALKNGDSEPACQICRRLDGITNSMDVSLYVYLSGDSGASVSDMEMIGWHHQLNGRESEQAPGDGE